MSTKKTTIEENTEAVQAAMAEADTASVTETKRGLVIYIGPTIPGAVAQNTVFNNGITAALAEEAEKLPAIKSLIVPVEKLAAAQKEIKINNSALTVCYRMVEDYIKKGER